MSLGASLPRGLVVVLPTCGRLEAMISPELSVVIPCHNEEESVAQLLARIVEAVGKAGAVFEIIFVDDGSSDGTSAVLEECANLDSRISYLSFSRNFGKEAAILAGLRAARGSAVVLMDADLQHPPELVPVLLERFRRGGVDQVLAKRDRRGDPAIRSFLSRRYYGIANLLVDDIRVEDGVGDFRLLSRDAVNAVLNLGERSRFSKGLMAWIGFTSDYVLYENQVRKYGASSWRLSQLLNYSIDGVISFNTKPLRIMAGIGLVSVLTSLLYVLFLIGRWFIFGTEAPGYITTIALVTFLGGLQLLSLGVIGEYVGRIFLEVKKRPHYIVQSQSSGD